jgi:tetratricopeptide (TPR) repeat protein
MKNNFWKYPPLLLSLIISQVGFCESGEDVLGGSGASAPYVGVALNGLACEGGSLPYGPYDYSNNMHRSKKLPIVEIYHFTKNMEQLKGSLPLAQEFDYTITTFPNHHKALTAAMYYEILYFDVIKKGEKSKLYSPLECYFQRGINFSPKDGVVRMLFGKFLKKKGLTKQALEQYKKATEVSPKNSVLKYNYALFLIKLKKYKEAKIQAKAVYKLKHKNQKLKNILKKAGHWD